MGISHVYRSAKLLTGDTSVLTASLPANHNGLYVNPLGVRVTQQLA